MTRLSIGARFIQNPGDILGSNLIQWCRADQGITISTGVSQWNDISGNNKNYTQNTSTSFRPTYNVTDATLNNQSTITFDGTDDSLTSSLSLPAPGTTPTYIWMVIKLPSKISARVWLSDGTASQFQITNSGTTNIAMNNGGGQTNITPMTDNVWYRVEISFTNSTADFIKVGQTQVTGNNAGNSAGSGTRNIATNATNSNNTAMSMAEIFYAKVTPTAIQREMLDTYCANRYNANLILL